MQRILVTGATGYIGRHLIATLHRDGIPVRGFSRRERPEDMPAVEWFRGDLASAEDVLAAVTGCEVVAHLACGQLAQSFQQPVHDFTINAVGTLHLLEAARSAGVRHVVYTSTAQVYGRPAALPVVEDAPTQPVSPYAASKLCGETLCAIYARCFGVGATCLRLFNVYGAAADGAPRPTVETVFLRRALHGQPLVINSAPDEGRDFVHVRDVVHAIRRALDLPATGAMINIGSGALTTMLELAELVRAVTGSAVEIQQAPTPPSPMRLQADIQRARQVLDYQPSIALRDGLAEIQRNL